MLKKILVDVGDYNDSSQTQLFVVPIIDLDKIYSHLFPRSSSPTDYPKRISYEDYGEGRSCFVLRTHITNTQPVVVMSN